MHRELRRRPPSQDRLNQADGLRFGAVMAVLCATLLSPACGGDPEPAAEADPTETPDAGDFDAGPIDAGAAVDAGSAVPDDVALPKGAKALILAVVPASGPTAGLTEVEISGLGLSITDQVFFAESPAVSVDIVDDHTLNVVAPPRPPGMVDVIVRLDDAVPEKGIEATEITFPSAFRYVADVKVSGVAPKHGPSDGGTLVTVTGAGFTKDTQFVFGERLGIDPLIVDEHTAAVHTPPGLPGRVNLIVANSDGSAKLQKAFTYRAFPTIATVSPATASKHGGGTVTLHGSGLLSSAIVSVLAPDGTSYKAKIKGSEAAGARLHVDVPPVKTVGIYGIRYSSGNGTAEALNAITYVGATPAGNQVASVYPAAAPANVPTKIAVSVTGPIAGAASGKVQVTIDGSKCEVLDHDIAPGQSAATVQVLTPPTGASGLPKKVDVYVKVGELAALAKERFTYLPAIPRIVKVNPSVLDWHGGTKMEVTYGPNPTAFGNIVGARIGALLATGINGLYKKGAPTATITMVAPKGSPGPADLRLVFENGEILKPKAVVFAGLVPKLGALTPARGSQAGGTYAQLIGNGLHRAKRLFIGDHEVKKWKAVHPGLIELYTPQGDPGPAHLEVWFKDDLPKQQLEHAFVYYDPMSGNYGTWGPPIDGAVNVTVMQSNMGAKPLEGAMVVVGTDPHTPYRGLTDSRGQVTFSDKIFKGPIMVSATKAGYTAASVVAVNTENVTLRLRKHPTPSPGAGAGQPPEKYKDGTISGTVVNAAKYLQLPMGDCGDSPVTDGHCKTCKTDADCAGKKTKCELLTDPLSGFNVGGDPGLGKAPDPPAETTLTGLPVQKYCTSACLEDADCPSGFECRATAWTPGNTKYRCTPSIGKPEIRCETSSPSMFGGNPKPGPGASVDKDYKFTINSRLGDLAVICRAGYIEKKSGAFKVLMLGVTEHVHVSTGKLTSGVKVHLSVPLNRRIRVRLDRLPMGPDAVDMRRGLTFAIDLDAQGYIPMGEVETTNMTDMLVLGNQPSSFTGPLAGKNYSMYGGARQLTGGTPVAIAMAENVVVDGADHIALWKKGDKNPVQSTAMSQAVNDISSGGGETYAVGDNGYIGAWSGTGFTQQACPVAKDLHAVWALPGGGDAWAGGDDGVLLRRYELGWKAMISPTNLRIVDIAGNGKDKVWLLTSDNQLQRRVGEQWLYVGGPLPVPKPKSVWYEKDADKVGAILYTTDGWLVAAGHRGGLWRAKPSDTSAALNWAKLPTATNYTLRALWGPKGDDFFVAGDRGFFGRFVGGKLTSFEQHTTRPLYAIAGTSNGVDAVGGLGAWVHLDNNGKTHDRSIKGLTSDLRGVAEVAAGKVAAGQPVVVIGPYVEMPYFDKPKAHEDIGNRMQWHARPGVTPTLNLVRITNYGYATMWELFVKGNVTDVKLPDFTKLGVVSPLPGGQLRIRLWRIYAPGLDIDHFNHKQLSIYRWVSYAYNWMLTNQSVGPIDATLPPQIPPGIPQLPPGF